MSYNILIVDDSKTVCSVLEKVVNLSNIDIGKIVTAHDGREALNKLNGEWVDLILTDLNMPGMNGMDLIKAVKSDALLASIPIIVISSDGNKKHIEAVSQAGICHYLRKPFTPEEVEETIRTTLEIPNEQSANEE